MRSFMCDLQNILPRLRQPKNLPRALPLIHVSKSGKEGFKQIINNLSLSPRHCQVFGKHLLYFSYGDVFYDTGNKPTRDEDQLPICFLFDPKALSEIDYYYPYDTGAAYFYKYGRHSQHLKDNFERYRVNGDGNNYRISRKLIRYIYGTNRNYINRKIKNKIQPQLYKSLPDLFDFFEDQYLDIEGCDERQYTIECQGEKNMNLKYCLEWIAFPYSYYNLYTELFNDMQPSPPKPYPYHAGAVFNPLTIKGKIQGEAQSYIERKYLKRR